MIGHQQSTHNHLFRHSTFLLQERAAYFVHPHLDPLWTDGYQVIAEQILQALPDSRWLVFTLGCGGLLMGLTTYLIRHPAPVKLLACEPHNYPKYTRVDHPRTRTIADGLILEHPHPPVQQRIADSDVSGHLIHDSEIIAVMKDLFTQHALVVEPSSAITTAGGRVILRPTHPAAVAQDLQSLAHAPLGRERQRERFAEFEQLLGRQRAAVQSGQNLEISRRNGPSLDEKLKIGH